MRQITACSRSVCSFETQIALRAGKNKLIFLGVHGLKLKTDHYSRASDVPHRGVLMVCKQNNNNMSRTTRFGADRPANQNNLRFTLQTNTTCVSRQTDHHVGNS